MRPLVLFAVLAVAACSTSSPTAPDPTPSRTPQERALGALVQRVGSELPATGRRVLSGHAAVEGEVAEPVVYVSRTPGAVAVVTDSVLVAGTDGAAWIVVEWAGLVDSARVAVVGAYVRRQ